MPTYTVTYIDVVQNEYETDTPEAAVQQFLAGEDNDSSLDPERTLYVKEGRTNGDDWFGLAEDLVGSSPYEWVHCEQHGDHYRVDGECPEPHPEEATE